MKYKTEEFSARYARALKGASNLASVAAYQPVSEPALLPSAFREGINVPSANVLLVPSCDGQPHGIEQAVREVRCTAFVIEAGSTTEGQPIFYFTLLHPKAGEIRRYTALRLWVGIERDLYFVPDPHSEGSDCFTMDERGVRFADAPWAHEADYAFGVAHGDALLLAP